MTTENARLDNPAYARGIAQAKANSLRNCRGLYEGALNDLKRVSLNRDATQAGRDSYERTYARVRAEAVRYADASGTSVAIPKYLSPPVSRDEFVTIEPSQPVAATVMRDDLTLATITPSECYTERGGKGPSGAGLPLRGPGSNTDPNWPASEGGAK